MKQVNKHNKWRYLKSRFLFIYSDKYTLIIDQDSKYAVGYIKNSAFFNI